MEAHGLWSRVDHDPGYGCMHGQGAELTHQSLFVTRTKRGAAGFDPILATCIRDRDTAWQGGVSRWRAGSLTVCPNGGFPR